MTAVGKGRAGDLECPGHEPVKVAAEPDLVLGVPVQVAESSDVDGDQGSAHGDRLSFSGNGWSSWSSAQKSSSSRTLSSVTGTGRSALPVRAAQTTYSACATSHQTVSVVSNVGIGSERSIG